MRRTRDTRVICHVDLTPNAVNDSVEVVSTGYCTPRLHIALSGDGKRLTGVRARLILHANVIFGKVPSCTLV